MFYITKVDSETGKRFQEVKQKIDKACQDQNELADELKIKNWRNGYWCVAGRFSAVLFEEDVVVDKKVWKNVNNSKNEWMPRLNSKLGKEIQAKFDKMSKVSGMDLNKCIGFDSRFSNIGVNFNNEDYIGFTTIEKMMEENGLVIPEDCVEITYKQYKDFFSKDETN